jgi:A/G-specific adenine glycosylase
MAPGSRGHTRYPAVVRSRAVPLPSAQRLRAIRRRILGWYAEERRDFPWRRRSDPWAVLVSEVMLQQTQAGRVAERFDAFMSQFPTPIAMASATDAEVLAAWSGLGYNRRAVTLRQVAREVAANGWPHDVGGLERLPGVGPYTARAVAALAFGQPVGAVDTNVRRWLVRRFGVSSTASPRDLQGLADALAEPARGPSEAASWMHASMEFGGAICTARRPACERCPISRGCPSRGLGLSVPVPRQATFNGSVRERRGRILRLLAAAPGHRLPLSALHGAADGASLPELIGRLERDGLVHRSGELLLLGGPASPATVATIEP